MDKSNIAFALITAILAVYIAVALVLSRMAGNGSRSRNKHPNTSARRSSPLQSS